MLGAIFSDFIQDGVIAREDVFLIDKIDGWQMHEGKGAIKPYVLDALQKLQTDYLDLLLIHWPFPDYLVETWEAFEQLHAEGVIRSIGLCNVEARHLKRLSNQVSTLPHVIQIERNPLNSAKEVIQYCQNSGILVQGYSPVCRMHPKLADSEIIAEIAEKYGKTKGQVILRWHFDTGVSPVFMTSRRERLVEYTEILDFRLTEDDVAAIDHLNEDFQMFLCSRACPGY
jgi:diketogulonate reductase-like aldo/keto reductase